MNAVLSQLQRLKGRILLYSLGIFLGFHFLQIGSLIVRFQELPNYIEVYPWWENILRIIDSTPSLKDTIMIVRQEWWLEIGYMNYAFGLGISEWSFYFSPVKAMGVLVLSFLVASVWSIASDSNSNNNTARENWRIRTTKMATSVFGALAGLSSMTLYWVVCCATPTWSVALGILGVSVPIVLAVDPWGSWLYGVSFTSLLLLLVLTARRSATRVCDFRTPREARTLTLGEIL